MTQIVRSFSADWKRAIEAINAEILQSFTNLQKATSILQVAFTQFINYYQRFTKILEHETFAAQQETRDELVSAPLIIDELSAKMQHWTATISRAPT